MPSLMQMCIRDRLTIIDYNRVVKDLNGMTPEEFLAAVGKNFIVDLLGHAVGDECDRRPLMSGCLPAVRSRPCTRCV